LIVIFEDEGREGAEVRKTGNASSRCDDGRMHACVRASASEDSTERGHKSTDRWLVAGASKHSKT